MTKPTPNEAAALPKLLSTTFSHKGGDEVPALSVGRGGARPGAGRPTIPGLSQYKLTLDDKAYSVFQEYGKGNASLGARVLAQHVYERALVVGLRKDVDDALQSLAKSAGVSAGEVVEQLVLEAWAKVSAGQVMRQGFPKDPRTAQDRFDELTELASDSDPEIVRDRMRG